MPCRMAFALPPNRSPLVSNPYIPVIKIVAQYFSCRIEWFIDVRDDAQLHVQALINPSLGGKRIWGVASPFGWNQIFSILREKTSIANVPADIEGKQGEPDRQRIDNSVATEALGGWISLEQSILDSVKSFGL